MEIKLTQTIFSEKTRLKLPAIILGGLALPAYNVFRTSMDIDICVYVNSQEVLDDFIIALNNKNIKTLQQPKIEHDLFTVFGQKYEAKIWLKPCDAFSWDLQMVERIQKYTDEVSVLSVEDYILTKLARADRSSTNIDDILQILINNLNKIDWKYLRFRLKWKDLTQDFKEILKAFEITVNEEYQLKGRKIIEKFYNEE